MNDHMIRVNDETYQKLVEKRSWYIYVMKKNISVSKTIDQILKELDAAIKTLGEKYGK